MMKNIFFLLFLFPLFIKAQETSGSTVFWENLQKHCGKAYEGKIIAGAEKNDGFSGEKLIMHIRSCEKKEIKIPFHVGENRSRTWVLSKRENNLLLLKHDHRNPDGSEEEITQYGGFSTNSGNKNMQIFPADQETSDMLAPAFANVWWITLDDTSFTYNLRRIGSDRLFTVKFDLSKEVQTPPAPWGSKD